MTTAQTSNYINYRVEVSGGEQTIVLHREHALPSDCPGGSLEKLGVLLMGATCLLQRLFECLVAWRLNLANLYHDVWNDWCLPQCAA